jgi:Protein of unknown function (DUF3617)
MSTVTTESLRMPGLAMALLCSLPALPASAKADNLTIEPGRWRVTSNSVFNGGIPQRTVKSDCLTQEQAGDVVKTFGPGTGTIHSTCDPTEVETSGRKLKWHLQCKGQLDLDMSGDFIFDSPTHYTATLNMKVWVVIAFINMKTEVEGKRVGACRK